MNNNKNIDNANINEIQKPVSLIIEESRQVLINTINSVNLHPTLLEMIMKDLYNEVREQARNQAERENTEYKMALDEQNSKQESTEK